MKAWEEKNERIFFYIRTWQYMTIASFPSEDFFFQWKKMFSASKRLPIADGNAIYRQILSSVDFFHLTRWSKRKQRGFQEREKEEMILSEREKKVAWGNSHTAITCSWHQRLWTLLISPNVPLFPPFLSLSLSPNTLSNCCRRTLFSLLLILS